MSETIAHRIFATAPIVKAYDALATAEGIRQWWTTNVESNERGDVLTMWFYERTQFNRICVVEQHAPHRLVWGVPSSSIPDLDGTRVTLELKQAGDDTQIDLTHEGFASRNDVFRVFSSGWYLYLSSLRQYLETGTGHPHPYLDFAHPHLRFDRVQTISAQPGIAYGSTTR